MCVCGGGGGAEQEDRKKKEFMCMSDVTQETQQEEAQPEKLISWDYYNIEKQCMGFLQLETISPIYIELFKKG